MAELKYFRVVFVLTMMALAVQGLQLEGLSTKKPRTGKGSTKIVPTATVAPSGTATYRINGTSGTACILIRTDGLLSIQYRNKLKEDVEANVFLPQDAELVGDCSEEDYESFTMMFKGFQLKIYFRKTPGGERWYITNMELTYSSENQIFEHIDRPNLSVKLTTPPSTPMYFPTPVGKSYNCDEQVVTMFSPDPHDMSGHLAKLYLRELRMQSFMYKASNQWGPTFQCSATGTYRDETAPLAVGTTLAVAVLATVSGYGAWRYFKIKKVQYGTME